MHAEIILEALELPLDLGIYGPGDLVPDTHLLDIALTIDPALVLIEEDKMERIYDYDPLIAAIQALSQERHYETQEFLLTRIAKACAGEAAIQGVWLKLYKRPVRKSADGSASGTLGVTLSLTRQELDRMV